MTAGEPAGDESVAHVVALIHGIRTQAYWQGPIAEALQAEDPSVVVKALKYDYFDVLRFWCPVFTRRRPVRVIKDELDTIRELHPRAKVSVVAHSFGTYILGQILLKTTVLHFHRVILCGSVLSRDFPWSRVSDAIDPVPNRVVNDYSPGDPFPVLAQSLSWGYGASGTHGFGKAFVDDRPHAGGHGVYFEPGFAAKYWAPLLVHGCYQKSGREAKPPPAGRLASILGVLPLRYVILAALAALLVFAVWWLWPGAPQPARWARVAPDANLPAELGPVAAQIRGLIDDPLPASVREEVTRRRAANGYDPPDVDRVAFTTGPVRPARVPDGADASGVDASIAVYVLGESAGRWFLLDQGHSAHGTVSLDAPGAAVRRTCLLVLLFPLDRAAYRAVRSKPPEELIRVHW
jgi:hypothetical protein